MSEKEICDGCGKYRVIRNESYHLCERCNKERLRGGTIPDPAGFNLRRDEKTQDKEDEYHEEEDKCPECGGLLKEDEDGDYICQKCGGVFELEE